MSGYWEPRRVLWGSDLRCCPEKKIGKGMRKKPTWVRPFSNKTCCFRPPPNWDINHPLSLSSSLLFPRWQIQGGENTSFFLTYHRFLKNWQHFLSFTPSVYLPIFLGIWCGEIATSLSPHPPPLLFSLWVAHSAVTLGVAVSFSLSEAAPLRSL